MFLQETYVVEDCVKYDETEYSNTTSSSTEQFTDMYPTFDFDASNNFELTIDYHQSSSNGSLGLNPVNQGTSIKYHFIYGQQANATAIYYGNSSGTESASRHTESGKFNQWLSMKFVKENGVVTVYRNDTLYDTISSNEVGKHGNMNIGFTHWASGLTQKVKNLKIKAL